MPLYDYRCGGCGKTTESRQGVDVGAIPCRCGSEAARVQVYRSTRLDLESGDRGAAVRRRQQERKDRAEREKELVRSTRLW
jgi:putative FmdB family regulatory protein